MRVAYKPSVLSAAAPPEVSALLAASTESERDHAWGAFVNAFTAQILRVARSIGGDHDVIMDRYAFVLDRLHEDGCRRIRAYIRPGAGEFTLWLIVVVRRLCLDHYRERYGRPRDTSASASEPSRSTRRQLVDLVADRTDPASIAAPADTAPDELLARSERTQALTAALERLSPRDRLLLRFRFAEELPAREIAKLMRFPTLFHVYRRLDKVLDHLREALRGLGVQDTEP